MKNALLLSAGAIGGSLAAGPIEVKFQSLGETAAALLYLPAAKAPSQEPSPALGLVESKK